MDAATTRRGLGLAGMALGAAGATMIGRARAEGPESTLDRVQRTKTLRIAALPGELPWFRKDIATGEWDGAAVACAKSIASVFDAKVAYVESTYGNSILDLQSNKVDIAFALNPTPQRALAVRFAHPLIIHPFGCLAKHGLDPKTWADIDKPDLKIAVDMGSVHETVAHRFCPKAQIIGFKNRDDCILALQAGRVDVDILAAILGITAVARNRSLGPYHLLHDPLVALPSNIAVQYEPDTRFLEVVNAWLDFNRGIGTIRQYCIEGMALVGAKPEDIPPELSF